MTPREWRYGTAALFSSTTRSGALSNVTSTPQLLMVIFSVPAGVVSSGPSPHADISSVAARIVARRAFIGGVS